MADKLRQVAQRLKDKVHIPQINAQSRDKVDKFIAKYVPAAKVTEIAEKFKQDTLTKKVKDLITRYEKFTGVEEIMAIQNTVIDAQEKFISAQDRRRELGREVAIIESRLKELHAEMQNTMKGDEKYLHLCTEEHKLIIQERALRGLFAEAEKEERELFATMSAAVKLGHERERAHAERNKYWYIVASILGTVLGIAGSTINNRLKMAEFRDMLEQQTARSAGVLYSMAGGGVVAGEAGRGDVASAVKAELAYQQNLAESLQTMQQHVENLAHKQSSLIDHINHREHYIETQLKDLKRIIVAASQTSAKSDELLAKALQDVHHDIDEEKHKEHREPKDTQIENKVSLEPNQILMGVGFVMAMVIVFGNILGRS